MTTTRKEDDRDAPDIERLPAAATPDAPAPWPDSTAYAGLVFTTQIPDRPDGTVELGPIRAQAEVTLENLRRCLEAAGSGLDRLLHLTIYLTDMSDREGFNEVYARLLATRFPARCAIGISALAIEGMRVEVTAVAATRERDAGRRDVT